MRGHNVSAWHLKRPALPIGLSVAALVSNQSVHRTCLMQSILSRSSER